MLKATAKPLSQQSLTKGWNSSGIYEVYQKSLGALFRVECRYAAVYVAHEAIDVKLECVPETKDVGQEQSQRMKLRACFLGNLV